MFLVSPGRILPLYESNFCTYRAYSGEICHLPGYDTKFLAETFEDTSFAICRMQPACLTTSRCQTKYHFNPKCHFWRNRPMTVDNFRNGLTRYRRRSAVSVIVIPIGSSQSSFKTSPGWAGLRKAKSDFSFLMIVFDLSP